ncbi:MAG: YafY family transcriptional regulator [Spirochaetes bacterium]|nr:YafY family transcriptional regulator [Spirochaetota bacterium]
MKIDRLIGILMMLINKKKVTARQLSEYFEVSVRTIQRDMDTLNMAGIPLYADVGVSGGYQLMDNFRLEKGFLNKDEANILLTFLKGLEGVTPYSEIKSIYNKFSSMDFHELDSNKLIVKLNPVYNTSKFRDHLMLFSQARDKQLKLKITYYDVNFNITTRIICPYSLLLLSSTWYFFAYCDLRSDFRMFSVKRIAECELTDEPFEMKDMPEQLPWETEMDSNRKSEEIILEIDKNLQNKLPDYFDPASCQVSQDKIIMHLNVSIDEWVYSLIMGLVPYVKIIKPDSLRKDFVERLKKSINDNSPEKN